MHFLNAVQVPKTAIRISLTSPNLYKSARSMTLARIFQKILSDDLNSYAYDATIAGSFYRVSCTPFGFSIVLTGFSEKLIHLLEVVVKRIFSLLEQMREQESVELEQKFEKAKHSLLIETRNLRLDSPYELANYNSRMVSVSYLILLPFVAQGLHDSVYVDFLHIADRE